MSPITETTGSLVLTVDQTAAELGIGRNAVYGEIANGRLKSITHGRRRRIARVDLVAFVNLLRKESQEHTERAPIAPNARRAAAKAGRA